MVMGIISHIGCCGKHTEQNLRITGRGDLEKALKGRLRIQELIQAGDGTPVNNS